MKKGIIFIVFSACVLTALQAQDIILKSDGEEIQARVTEVGTSVIKYQKFSNLSGPVYSIVKSKVFMITYESGDKDIFGRTKEPVQQAQATPPAVEKSPAKRRIYNISTEIPDEAWDF
ncbi:MAG: hypothetical protein LBT04_07500 [Prevotellaceae bacterium]|jgi:hypothetical protein|nr:hypothetical protein [Prevotellaceae bacterium]